MVRLVGLNLRNEDSVKAMRSELGRAINFPRLELDLSTNINTDAGGEAGSAWALVQRLLLDFKKKLEEPAAGDNNSAGSGGGVGGWMIWLEGVAQKCIGMGGNGEKYWRLTR
jgi:hypothetical protein